MFGNQLRLNGRGKTSCPSNKDSGMRNWLLRSAYLTAWEECVNPNPLFLALRPPKLSRSSAEHMTEMTR
jgi:hypothetical protein